jgi:hypothetical protein
MRVEVKMSIGVFWRNVLPPYSGLKTTMDSLQLVLFRKEDTRVRLAIISIDNKIIRMFQSNK